VRIEREQAATVALKYGGAAALRQIVASWPPQVRGHLHVAHDLSGQVIVQLDERLPPPPPTPVWWLVIEFLACLVFSAVLAIYITRPIERLRVGFSGLASGDLTTRLRQSMGRRRDEIADLARDFDVMAERLEQLASSRVRLLHDVSHELRSPLARMSVAMALARQNPERTEEALGRIEADGARLNAIVGDLLSLSRAEADFPRDDSYFDVFELLEVVCSDVRFEAQPRRVDVELRLVGPPAMRVGTSVIAGAPELVRRAFENVVRNALRYSPDGAVVSVAGSVVTAEIIIEVRDRGPGVDPHLLDAIFDPFVKGSDEESGAGLGLSIARRAIVAHAGRIEALLPPGGGLLVRIALPAAGA